MRSSNAETPPRDWPLAARFGTTIGPGPSSFPRRPRGPQRRRPTMNVHEFQAKELLRSAGVAVPEGIVATTPDEAVEAFDRLGAPLVVVKAQVHAGGRGKGVAVGPEADAAEALAIASGKKPRPEGMAKGVQLVKSRDEVKKAAAGLLGKRLITYQTGIDGAPISKVLVTVGHDIAREL